MQKIYQNVQGFKDVEILSLRWETLTGLWRQCWVGARGTKKSWRSHLFLLESSDFRERWRKETGTNHFMGDFFFFSIIFCGHFSVGEMPPLLFKHDWKERDYMGHAGR